MCKILKKPVSVGDCSAIVTGLLLALNLPARFPLWMTAIGALFAIVVVKMLFGGLGQNFMNPALGARCFLVISFARYMTNFDCDAFTGPTPLAVVKAGGEVDVFNIVICRTSGTIGETSMIAIVLGACFLIALGIIDLKIPGSYILSFVIFILIFSKRGFDLNYICAQLAGGGLMLGAFFMATDYVTRPVTKFGQIIFGIVLGLLTGIFRVFGASSEGVSYAIIIGNMLTPLITKITAPKAFGDGGERI
jgi:electron transport complex protein RnfD/electron transport complex protein RnfC